MHHCRRLLYRGLCIALPFACALLLLRILPPVAATVVTMLIGGALCATGALLLKTSSPDRVTWKNHVAGWLLPWGYVIGRGRLPRITLISAGIWSSIAIATVVAQRPSGDFGTTQPPLATALPAPAAAWPWLMLASWLVLGTFLLLLLGAQRQHAAESGARQRLGKVMLCLGALLTTSVALHVWGSTSWAAIVAGTPLLAGGTLYGVFLLSVLALGRGARWN